jgi:type IV fimbrial biogenesis protein FimT
MQEGATLIELMIGLVIVAILLVAGAPSIGAFMRNTKIRNSADAVQAGLNRARAESVRRNTNVQFSLNGSNSSWTIGCVTDPGDLDGDGVSDCPASIETRAADNAATITVAVTPAAASTVSFNGLGRVTSLAAGTNATFDISDNSDLCVASGGTTRCLRVVATPGGQIRMCDPDPALASSNPQSC